MLTEKKFEILLNIYKSSKKLSQRDLASRLDCSVGTINKLLKELAIEEYVIDGNITEAGIDALAPYKVKRIIFIAAGVGSRLLPITINTPKPLIRVNGTRIIDTMLDAAIAAGIEEIIIVRGYLMEQFNELLIKYPNIKFIDNPLYNECNNISSALAARSYFSNAYVCDADIILKNKALIRGYEYKTFMYGVKTERTDDWCLTTDNNNYVESLRIGGFNGYREVGISYWTKEDGNKLLTDFVDSFNYPGGKEKFWELTPLEFDKKNYKVSIKECNHDDFIEIDSFNELKKIDNIYNI